MFGQSGETAVGQGELRRNLTAALPLNFNEMTDQNFSDMTDQEIIELAAILVNEYGHAALDVAEQRRDQHAHKPHSDSYRVWARIAEATARLLRASHREPLPAGCSGFGGVPQADRRGRRT